MAKRSWGLLVDLHVKVPNSYKFKSPMVDELSDLTAFVIILLNTIKK